MIYIIIAACVIVFILFSKKRTAAPQKAGYKPNVEPPTDNIAYDGCMGPMFCGYCSPKIVSSGGNLEMIEDVYECAYLNRDVNFGTSCAFAKEHPDKLREYPLTFK